VEVQCPVVQPDVVVISNNGQTLTDFGQVSVGQRVIKSITVQNTSDHPVDVSLRGRYSFLLMGLKVRSERQRKNEI